MARRGGSGEGMPSTGAGLIRYFDEDTQGPKVEPKVIVGFCIGIIVFEILLHGGVIG
ncbi:MAG: preprotein translocase subunit Sec61beta [Candidatus Hadarchaeia archaeon]